MRTGRIDGEPAGAGAAMNGRSRGAHETTGPQVGAAEPMRDFALALERRRSGTAVLVLGGELDLYRAPEVENALAEALGGQIPGEEVRRLVVDLRSVTFIDSTTLVTLLAASRRQHARGAELLILVGPQTPMTALEVTGFDRLLAIKRVDDDPRESAA